MVNLTEFLDTSCANHPDKIAIDYDHCETWTYHQLLEAVKSFSTGLYKLGLAQGDHIGLALPNSPEFVIAHLAIIRAGMVVIPLNVMLQKLELQYQLSDTEAVGLITNKRFARIFNEIEPEATSVKHMIIIERDSSSKARWQGIDLSSTEHGTRTATTFDTLAQITYTAAIDGYPMGAMLTHGNLWSNCLMTMKGMGTCREDRYLSAIPLFHTYGAMATCMSPLAAGATVYLQSRFNPRDFLECMKNDRITVLNGVPTLYAGLLFHDDFNSRYFDSVRLIIAGGSALPFELSTKYRDIGLEIREGYGLTECSPCVSVNPFDGPNKLTSIGLALEGAKVKIVDRLGQECPTNSQGELLVSGPLVMKGYWKKMEATAQTIVDGWLHTGDIGWKDSDQYLYLTGRCKRMLITGGFNVYPREVERLLGTHPKIQDVSVEAIPDKIQGELGKAIIQLKHGETATEKEFMHYAKRVMAIYKVPRVIELKH
ncbi:AMP-binding protein [bacterium]|nr:AMP-binding protein [bacterium]